ncbi:FecCD family ABC transporter permease [Pseudoroseicyclus aestuarii]|uniref:Iron complex transport system permease protein n=1 Tax=Pseudoroseicyclus aestuarii TaxID=1795041 RepID=A0A318SVT9_9RHOB|nr:iron ABC transporter permease [Pseudoroseicyclus aestuarii]PYE84489.1 iron complex transport system permease protein [Pseudoroseicyclus aestuarii]
MTALPAAAPALAAHAAQMRWRRGCVAVLAGLVLAALLASLMSGPSPLPPLEALRALILPDEAERVARVIVWTVRLPQALTALLVGAALALAGAEMQTILDNPLASPFTLGISSAASFGAALALILGVSVPGLPAEWLVPANAFLFAALAMALLRSVAGRPGTGPSTLVLLGIALVFAFNAMVALLQYTASQSALQQFVFWTMGSVGQTGWGRIGVLALALAVVAPLSWRARWMLTALRLGEDRARSFGIDTGRLRTMALIRITLLSALSVAFVGTIGFVGLVGPHIARLLVGEDHVHFLPASALTGALVMLLAAILSELIVQGVVLPIGIVTSLVGVPVFLALVLRRKDGL